MGWIIIVFLLAHCQQQPFSCFIFMSGEYYGLISAAATDSLHFQLSQTWIGHQLAYLFIIIIYLPIGFFSNYFLGNVLKRFVCAVKQIFLNFLFYFLGQGLVYSGENLGAA